MKTYQSFLLISVDSVKRIDATEALAYLLISSSISRIAPRRSDLKLRTREMMTSFSGIHPFTGDTVHVKVHPVVDGRWLLTVTVNQDCGAGTPSPLSPSSPPALPKTHGLGLYKDMGPDAYRKNTHILYKSKRGRCSAPPLLPYRGKTTSDIDQKLI